MQERLLGGRYRLISLLGQGGMGSVWRAEHAALGTPAAVKLMSPEIVQNPDALGRFQREARAAASLRGAHVVQILDFGVDEGVPFTAMELLEGETLGHRLARVKRLEPSAAAKILWAVGKAMTRAHKLGIVHRDLKPENIFLAREGDEEVPKVLDFGIAKQLPLSNLAGPPATQTGALLGTPYYMSPEQLAGKRTVDHRADIWALAVIAFECLVGRRPFVANTGSELVLAVCVGAIPLPSTLAAVPPKFDAWFARGVQREPELRSQSAREALAELRRVSGLEPMAGPAYDALGAPAPAQLSTVVAPARSTATTKAVSAAPKPAVGAAKAAVGPTRVPVLAGLAPIQRKVGTGRRPASPGKPVVTQKGRVSNSGEKKVNVNQAGF
ncbi:serine/threonine-protein kinase [Myxococcota bacterium]